MNRQLLHIAPIFLALLIPLVDRATAIIFTAVFALGIYILYNRKKEWFLREQEQKKGYSLGVIFYPISVLVLMIIFPMHIAIAAWAIMALGDGFATIFGEKFPIKKIPWNPDKSLGGTLAFILFGTLGAAFFLWYLGGLESVYRLILFALGTAFVAALVESSSLRIEDNLSVPLAAGLFLHSLTFTQFPFAISLDNVLIGILLSSIAAFVALDKGAINLRGATMGAILSVSIFSFLGINGFLVGLAFFVLGSAATKFKHRDKAKQGLGHDRKIRSGRNVISNSIVAVYCALLAVATPFNEVFLLAFTAAIAAANSDTLSSELGQIFGKKPFMITNFRPAEPGLNGAISIQGTFIGLLGAAAIAAVSFLVGLISFNFMIIATIAGFAGMLIDSVLGATLENSNWLGNESVNFLCTLSAVLIAIIVSTLILGV
ncbi:MAG: TIGR00297 family protein [Candidatus Diapherotrites archaeon]|uniref:TIGR00297 family protein n=1 Tax=Candidatus Iainarchaeum sp. TaxID=3101447 RepID=A0A2D6LZY3_9ARCH|nr:TIGR00297 family protein [Candidatus Diapherotrites archaeon]|tara:strand:+ start:3171 stop:4463 length:1293 start_codon:yes stop_codon:yes gene_type:complete